MNLSAMIHPENQLVLDLAEVFMTHVRILLVYL